ncbi:TD and POZ domain-containing protein 4, partial [Trichonephila clavata]
MAKNNSWAPFTFLWTIENFHAFPSPDAICSPSFVINCMEKTEWKLRLDTYKDGDKLDDWVRCYLSRQKEDDGPKSIVVEFKISLLASDQSLLITRRQKQKFTKGGASEIQYFIKLQQVFIERRDQFLPNDTLTVQCKMWRTGTNISTSTLCSARSCLLKECNPFTWGVEQFNPFDIEQERKRTSCLKENTLILTLFLRKDRNETYVCIRGEIENCNGRRKGIGGEVSVLNKMGKVYVSRYSDGVFTSSETEFDLITVSELLKYRSSLLPNNMLTLRCDFEIACKEPESCDGTSKEVSKIVTKNEDLLEVQDELVFCCPLKKDLKYLYESKSDSDIEL